MSNQVILYDIATKDGNHCFSPNPWKTRMLLNYKQIPYRTHFLEFPDIAPYLSSLGMAPQASGAAYTVPSVTLADGQTHVGDSAQIAVAIERLYPEPAVQPWHATVSRAEQIWTTVMHALAPVLMPQVPDKLLRPPSWRFFVDKRRAQDGMTLADVADRVRRDPDAPWHEARPGFEDWVRLLGEGGDGPFVLGKELSYADILLVAWLKFLARVDRKVLDRVLAFDEAIRKQWEAAQPWVQRDN